ncbi:MAG: pirin family protein [Anaerolineales bacterium]
MSSSRPIAQKIEPQAVIEGADVLLRRSIAPKASNEYDPFLLFDHFAFNNPIEGPLVGFPMHPHRGIETVTYMLEGSVHHRDSLGNSGLIGPGDVQWMTSGRGIMHEELPRRGPSGRVNGFQLWVNLPAAMKMSTPRYQEVREADIPATTVGRAAVRAVAGVVDGVAGPVADIAASPIYLDVRLEPGGSFAAPIPAGHTGLAYVFEGEAEFGNPGQIASALTMVVLGDGDHVDVRSQPGGRFLLIAGAPFGEPIVPYGPFVMNTAEEIQQALRDLRAGTFVS